MDILRPFSLSKKEYRYIVVALDYVTKWAEAVALPVAGERDTASAWGSEKLDNGPGKVFRGADDARDSAGAAN